MNRTGHLYRETEVKGKTRQGLSQPQLWKPIQARSEIPLFYLFLLQVVELAVAIAKPDLAPETAKTVTPARNSAEPGSPRTSGDGECHGGGGDCQCTPRVERHCVDIGGLAKVPETAAKLEVCSSCERASGSFVAPYIVVVYICGASASWGHGASSHTTRATLSEHANPKLAEPK